MRLRGVAGAVAAALVGCVLGCAGPSRDDVYVYVPDAELRALAESAAAEWRACGSRQVFVTSEIRPGVVPILITDPSDPALLGHLGVTQDRNGEASYVMLATVRVDQGALAHEIGHVLFERASDNEHFGSGVMNNTDVTPDAHVTEEDCAALRAEFE